VELIPEDLPVAAFSAVEASLDGLLLPYWKHEYTGRGSSLTSDAVCLGVPVIYTQGTWIAETIRRFGAGVGCRDRDAASLEAAIEAFVRDHAALAAQARKRAVAARREYSWATFFERVPAGGLPWERRIADDESRERPEARSPARARPGECEHPAPRQATAAQRANSDRVSRTAPRTEGVMKTPQRFLVVEECLVDERGHYAAFVGGLAAWLAARGDEVEVWAHAAVASRVIPAGVGFQAAFRENWIEALFRRTRSRRTLLLLTHNLAFFRALRRAGKGRSWDCVVATDANIFHLLAWRVWLALAPRRTRLALVTIRAPWLCDYGAGGEMIFKRQAWLYRRAWRLFAGEIRTGRCRLATDTEANSAALGAFAGVPFVPVPLPRPDSLLERLGRPPPTEGGVRLGFIGRPTREKGFDRFLAAMAECVGGGLAEPLCFVVQWQEAPDVNTADREKLRELAARAPQRVKVVEGVLSEADYAALLGSLHAIVLPYVHSAYAGRGSSLAMDSLCAGRPLICTAGTWGAERMRACGAGIECGEDVASLVAAFARFAGEHGALTAAAQARMSLARDYFSWSRLMRQLDIDQPTAHRGGGRT
jgi:glycosyltransferase involved in cell wall biosynthesis